MLRALNTCLNVSFNPQNNPTNWTPSIILNSLMRKTKLLSNLEDMVAQLEPKPILAASGTGAELSNTKLYQKLLESHLDLRKEVRVRGAALEASSRGRMEATCTEEGPSRGESGKGAEGGAEGNLTVSEVG